MAKNHALTMLCKYIEGVHSIMFCTIVKNTYLHILHSIHSLINFLSRFRYWLQDP